MQVSRVLAPGLTWDRELPAVSTQCVCLLWAACHCWDFWTAEVVLERDVGKLQSSLSHPPVLCAKGQMSLCEHGDTSAVSPEHGIHLLCLLPATLPELWQLWQMPTSVPLSVSKDTWGLERHGFQKESQALEEVWKRYQDYDVFME